MRTFTQSFFLLGLLLALGAACLGQGGRRRPARRVQKSPPPVELEVIAPTPDESVKVGEASISYVPFDGRTLVSTSLDLYDEQRRRALGLDVGFVVVGKKVVRPDVVKFQLSTHDEDFRFRADYGFQFKTDSGLFTLGKVSRRRYSTSVGVNNEMDGELSFAAFEKVAGGTGVQLHVGPFVFELSDGQRQALRDVLSTVGMSSR
jgi:hypothetical protein